MIKQWSIIVGITGALVCGAAAAQDAKPQGAAQPAKLPTAEAKPVAGDAQNGKKLYMATGCYQCHGTVAHGSPRTGPMLLTAMPFTAFLRQLRKPDEMPPYEAKVLSDQQAADIFAYIQSLPRPVDHKTIKLLQP